MSFNIRILLDQKIMHISADNIAINNLCLCSHPIDPSGGVYEISATKDLVILTTEYAVQSNSDTVETSAAAYDIFTNNINAYDWNGRHLWNIADIVGDLNIPYFGGTVTTKDLLKSHFGFDESKYDDSSELFCCSAGNRLYVIDLNCQRLVQVLETR